jgi:hypothetical protein
VAARRPRPEDRLLAELASWGGGSFRPGLERQGVVRTEDGLEVEISIRVRRHTLFKMKTVLLLYAGGAIANGLQAFFWWRRHGTGGGLAAAFFFLRATVAWPLDVLPSEQRNDQQ